MVSKMKSKAEHASENTGKDFPEFNSDALQMLKLNIEHNLKEKDKASKESKYSRVKNERKKAKVEEKGNKATDSQKIGVLAQTGASEQNSQPRNRLKIKQDANQSTSKSVKYNGKRLRNGDVKVLNLNQKGNGNAGSYKSGTVRANGSSSRSDLRKEIEDLGGDEEDFDIVINAQSDSEIEGQDTKISGEEFGKDIRNFVQSLRINEVEQNEVDELSDIGYEGRDDAQPRAQEPKITAALNGVRKDDSSTCIRETLKLNKVQLVCFLSV